jgi:hypothetical protein
MAGDGVNFDPRKPLHVQEVCNINESNLYHIFYVASKKRFSGMFTLESVFGQLLVFRLVYFLSFLILLLLQLEDLLRGCLLKGLGNVVVLVQVLTIVRGVYF